MFHSQDLHAHDFTSRSFLGFIENRILLLQGWVTLQLTRSPVYSRGFLSARSVMGFLSDVYPAAADEVGKIQLIADEKVCGTEFVFF